jgi:3D (Asp-Asp-Asp) domain-containing protein
MKSEGPPRVATPLGGGDLARKAVLIGAVIAGVIVLIAGLTLVLSPAEGGSGKGTTFLGSVMSKSGHHSHHSGRHHGKHHHKSSSKSDDSGDSGSNDDRGSSSGGDSSRSGSSSSDGGSGDSTGVSSDGTSSTSDISGTSGTNDGTSGTSTSGIATTLSCTKVVTSQASLQAAVSAAGPADVICMKNPVQSGSGVDSLGNSLGSVGNSLGSIGSTVGNATNDLKDTVSGAASKILSGTPKQTVLHTTGYSFQDNQGGDNSKISCGIIHKTAGGAGTYDDPTTVAVPGHDGQNTETPCGTRIYVPKYQKYFIVEDTGATKYSDAHHIDIYVGGEGFSAADSKKCMNPVTTDGGSPVDATINPPPGLSVLPGPITENGGCNVADSGGGSSSGSN